MNTNHPTVEICFVFAFTYCKVRVYEDNEVFARQILKASGVEMINAEANRNWQEVDTRVLLELVARAVPNMMRDAWEGAANAFLLTPSK